MAHYRSVGEIPPKRHTQFRRPDGGLFYEELMGEEGFSSDSSLLYHSGVPSAIVDSRVWELPDMRTVPNHPLRPLHLRLHDLFPVVCLQGDDLIESTAGFDVRCNDAGHPVVRGLDWSTLPALLGPTAIAAAGTANVYPAFVTVSV